ncbi:MAG: hypothetical protein LQ340_004990 [Diploschistes diacapsis]|nr:MAG: hypothetical protein LQ340_004990 [Diploschistes diacapsis]
MWDATSRDYIESREDQIVDNHAQYCSVVRTGMGAVKMIIGGEVDAVWGQKPEDKDKPIDWVELKTSACIENDKDMLKYERKLQKFWIQSFLLGVPRIIVGFRTRRGILHHIEELETKNIPGFVKKQGNGSWDGLKATIDSEGVWRIRRADQSQVIEVTQETSMGHGDILSEEFLDWRQQETVSEVRILLKHCSAGLAIDFCMYYGSLENLSFPAEANLLTRTRTQQISPLVNSICSYAYQHGLRNDSLAKVIDLLRLPSYLDQGSITTLLKSLFPAEKVPPALICSIVASLGQGEQKPSPATQSLLLRWIILVDDVLEDATTLQRLYSVLFNLLDMLSISLELNRGAGNDQALNGLLQIYKEFYPEIVLGQGRKSRFEYPDPEWQDRLREIHSGTTLTANQASQTSSFRVARDGIKRRRFDIVPQVHAQKLPEHAVALEDIGGINDLVERYEMIEPPSQLVAAFDDHLLRTYLFSRQDKVIQRRIDNWLAVFLDSQLQAEEDGEEASKNMQDVLNGLLSYVTYTKVQALQEAYFDKLEAAILDNSEDSLTSLLSFYTQLLRSWTSHVVTISDIPTHNSLNPLVSHTSTLALQILTTHPSATGQAHILHHLSTLAHTISHAPTHPQIRILTPSPKTVYLLIFLTPTAFTLSSLTATLSAYKASFEHRIAKQHAMGAGPDYPRPYVNEFNGFLMDICNLLWRSRAFNTTDTNALGCLLPPSAYPALKRYTESLGPPQPLQGLFSLSYHPALAALSIAAFRAVEDRAIGTGDEQRDATVTARHAGPVTQRSLVQLGQNGGVKTGWGEYRLEVLEWLAARGVEGVKELMFRTMKLLMAGKGQRGSGSLGSSQGAR